MPELTVDSTFYRRVLGHLTTGVVVVTAGYGGEPVGMAINSFTSVSLEPPLVLFCAARSSTTWPHIRAVGSFCANVLAADQHELSARFAARDADRFANVSWRPGHTGAPILDGALAHIECTIRDIHDAGDHEIVVGHVLDLDHHATPTPLIFFRGAYHSLGSAS